MMKDAPVRLGASVPPGQPSISLAGVWLKKAGFEVGDFARITVADGVLVISSERLPDNENREK